MHIPNKRQVMTRYYGWYANRRGTRRKRSAAESPSAVPVVAEREVVPLTEARRRWAELLRRIYEVDPLQCPACGAEMRIVAFITERSVIDRILQHLRQRRETARSRGPPARRGRNAGTPAHA